MSLASAKTVTFIMTQNRAVAEVYYGGTLGLTRLPGDDFAAVYDVAGTTLRITEVADYTPSAHPALGWHVDDIVDVVTALTARGVIFTVYEGYSQDTLGIWTAPDESAKVAWFNDPDGNVLSLTQS